MNKDQYQTEMLRAKRADEIFDRLRVIEGWQAKAVSVSDLHISSFNDCTFRPDVPPEAVLACIEKHYIAERKKLELELDALYPNG